MIQKIDEIIDQYTPYSKSIPTWDREDIRKMMEEYARQECIAFLNDIRDYERENGVAITYDERDSEELHDIHLQNKKEK